MRFVEVNRKDVPQKAFAPTKLQKFIADFVESGAAIARIEDHQYKSVAIGVNTINASARRFGCYHVKAFARRGEIYIKNTGV